MRAPEPPGLGTPRIHLRCTDSTNERARELALCGAPHGTLVTAAEQSAGRGRGGRRWSAPAGSSILMSLLLRPAPRLLPLIAAVAVCDVAGERAQIKWPNDVVLAFERPGHATTGLAKLAGILIEGRPQQGWAVLGIGLNVAVGLRELPPELRPGYQAPRGAHEPAARPAASMGLAREQLEPTLAALLVALQARLGETPAQTLDAWRERDALRAREIAWSEGEGRAAGIDGDGRLLVAMAGGGQTALGSGEVHLERVG